MEVRQTVGQDQYLRAAVDLMEEAARHDRQTRRPLERLAVSYFWKACSREQAGACLDAPGG